MPRARLAEVAQHYLDRGGRSPINDCNRALLRALRERLPREVPLLWGNRAWHPFVTEALRDAYEAGARRVLAVTTSPYSSYSGCRQYREDLTQAVLVLRQEGRELAVDVVRRYFNHPLVLDVAADAVVAALREVSPRARLVFVTHSVPVTMDATAGPRGGAYAAQHRDVCEAVLGRVAGILGRTPGWDLAFCSRSGPPGQAWLEPDVGDHLVTLARRGVGEVVLVPVGFVSDHMEVVHDLDTVAAARGRDNGVTVRRSATVGSDPRFADALADLLEERAAVERGESPARVAGGLLGVAPDRCAPGCCPNPWGHQPAWVAEVPQEVREQEVPQEEVEGDEA